MIRTRLRPTRFLGTFILLTALIVAGCGGDSATPEPEVAPTPTLIPTLAPPATAAVAEATATTVPEATEEPAPEGMAEEGTTEQAPESETITEAETVTETEAVIESEGVTATETVTESGEITESEAVTATEEVTAAEETTGTEVMTGTRAMTEEHAVTEGAELAPSAEITGTEVITGLGAASEARVFFLQPTTNAIVPLTFTVVMSYTGVTLAPAADGVEGAGHMHILIDTDYVEAGEAIPDDETHRHFGNGATEIELGLTPGSHILRLQFADNNHIALEGEQYRHEIYINAVEGAPEQAVRIVSPTSGAAVPPTFEVTMAATGMNVEPAGPISEGAGHFHLLIDEPFVAPGNIIPVDETHLHFGQAQLTTTVTLEPGTYLLRLQMADGQHRALSGDQYRAEVQVIVAEDAPAQQVMFIKPADGATVTSPFLVGWAASGLIIESAGAVIRPEGGHLHLLIDEEFIEAGEAIPTDETHLHFGRGQTSVELTLEPGEHTLRLQMANGAHLAQDGAQYQDEITVTVR